MTDVTTIQGDTFSVGGTVSYDDSTDFTTWSGEVVLRRQPSTTALGDIIVTLQFAWVDAATGVWSAEATADAMATVDLGIYMLYPTFTDADGRRRTAPPFQVGVIA